MLARVSTGQESKLGLCKGCAVGRVGGAWGDGAGGMVYGGARLAEGLCPRAERTEFRLRLWAVDRRGHMAVGGSVTQRVHKGEGSPYRHAVEFGFEFDPTLLPGVLAGFQAIAEGRG